MRHTPWRGVWIEILLAFYSEAGPPVTPRGGVCGLKCRRGGQQILDQCHTPWRGVWIEICRSASSKIRELVTPRGGVCGLKCCSPVSRNGDGCHTPWRGVWIEIGLPANRYYGVNGHTPWRGVWIEIQVRPLVDCPVLSHPVEGCVD